MSSSIDKALVYLCASFVALVCVSWIGACKSGIEPVEAVISLDSATEGLKNATIVVDYSQSGAAPLSSAGHPACTSILPHVDTQFSDDGQGTLTIEAKSAQTFSGPLEVAACRMVPDVEGVAGSTIAARLKVSLVGGTTTAGARLEPQRLADARGGYRGAPSASAPGSQRPSAAGRAVPTGAQPAPAGSPASASSPRAAGSPKPAPGSASSMLIERDRSAGDRSGASPRPPAARTPSVEGESTRGDTSGSAFGGSRSGAGTSAEGAPPAAAPRGNDPSDNQPVAEYLVQIGVTSESGLLGALQFDVDHTGSSGGWQGSSGNVNCNFDAPAGLAVCNDKGGGRLSCALVDMNGFDTPAAIVTCVFKTSEGLDASQFALAVQDASGLEPDRDTPPPSVTMAITDLVRR